MLAFLDAIAFKIQALARRALCTHRALVYQGKGERCPRCKKHLTRREVRRAYAAFDRELSAVGLGAEGAKRLQAQRDLGRALRGRP